MIDQLAAGAPAQTVKTSETILRTHGLTKCFGRLEAVKDLNLELRR